MHRQLLALAVLLFSTGCVASRSNTNHLDDSTAWAAPPLERAIAIRDGHTGAVIEFGDMLDALAEADVVFLGETHIDETTHRVELAVYQGLIERRRDKVVLAMEMFERDVQPDLDAYLAGEIDEETFLSRVRPWNNYRSAYRPLIEQAREAGLPVRASNFPRPLVRRVAMEGSEVLDTLAADVRRQAPAEFFPNTPAYWRRVDNAIRSHRAMMAGRGGDEQRLYSTQSLWDNAMGESCAIVLDEHPGSLVLHVNGGFHSEYWDGTVHQLRLRKPQAKVLTVAIASTSNPAVAGVGGAPVADYVVFAEARATDLNDGTWSVYTSSEQEYRLHVPDDASDAKPAPLLIWLSDDGFTASEGMDLWKQRLGNEVAIAVLEPPYRQVGEDLGGGGRWFWADTFSSDVGSRIGAVERVWGYLLRHYPIDPARVCVAGEGTGATLAAAVGLLTDRIEGNFVALEPRRYVKIKDFPLPLPEFRGDEPPLAKILTVVGGEGDQAWWTAELEEYSGVGLDNMLIRTSDDPWMKELAAENHLRAALRIAKRAAAPKRQHGYILMESDSPRGHRWARLLALQRSVANEADVAVLDELPADTNARRVYTAVEPTLFTEPGALPRCPGPFGGTTVVVLEPDATSEAVEKWLAIEEDDPIAKHGRFHRLRVATADGERALPEVLRILQSEGRRNVLIVPAVFCADAARMQALRRSVKALEDQMTIRWRPGLGGEDFPVPPPPPAKTVEHVKHTLSVTLEPEEHHLSVQDRIELPLELCRAGVEFSLSSVLEISESDPAVTKVESDDEYLARYRLEAAPPAGVLELSYAGTFDFGLSDEKEQYTRGFRQTRGIVGPEGVYLDGGSGWVPSFDGDLIQFAVEVSAPDDWHVISQGNGTSRDEEGRARWDSSGTLEQVYLVGGPLVVERDSAGAVEVLVYLHERDETLSRKYLDATASYIEMYRNLIGPYPYGKFALVENFWETGYGMPSFTLLGPQVIRFPFILHSSYPHEILHNWWGNSVFVDYENGNWCEGITAYLADHLIKEQRGQGAEYRRDTLLKYRNYVREGRDFPLAEFRARHSAATEAVGYGKALMLFHMLRQQVGDDAFRKALVDFYRAQRGRRASFEDLRTAFEGVTETDLKPFFDQWINRVGAPQLDLKSASVRKVANGFQVAGEMNQVQDGGPFSLEVPLLIQTQEDAQLLAIEMFEQTHTFEFHVAQRPIAIVVDPMFDVFRLLDPHETPPTIGQIFGEPHILAILPASAVDQVELDMYRQLMESWQSEEHKIEIVLDTDLETLPADRGVWILGRSNRFARLVLGDSATAEISQSSATVQLGNEQIPVDDHTLVVIQWHPDNIEHAIGWISIEPAAAQAGLSRKLPHYGKYSHLAFEGAEPTNIVKGRASIADSPLVVDLRSDRSSPLPSPSIEPRQPLAELPPVFSQRALMEYVEWLASEQRGGRGLGTPELDQAARYIAEHMEAAGLQPGGDNGTWFQRFTVAEGTDGKPIETVNVVGVLPGTNPEWADQSVVLCAHYDHLGHGWPDVRAGNEGKLHPGADDNASGVAVMLELARNLGEGGGSRNLVVIAFSAEEAGRLGSLHYVKQPRFPLEGIRGVINLDTVGRLFDKPLAIHGTGTADEWQHIFRGCGFVTGIDSKNVPESVAGSDQTSFVAQGIPGVQVFTGAHEDYHRPTDTSDKIDSAGLVKVATFVKEALTYLLEREEPLTVRIGMTDETPKPTKSGGRKVLFGTVPDFSFQGEGVRIASLVADSPADKGGLKAGDLLVQLNDTKIEDLRGFSQFLKTLQPGDEVNAIVIRDDEEMELRIVVSQR